MKVRKEITNPTISLGSYGCWLAILKKLLSCDFAYCHETPLFSSVQNRLQTSPMKGEVNTLNNVTD